MNYYDDVACPGAPLYQRQSKLPWHEGAGSRRCPEMAYVLSHQCPRCILDLTSYSLSKMPMNKQAPSKFEKVRAEQLEYNASRAKGYREQALKIYPWICGRCAREFNRAGLSELTVHHVDHDHDNNPADGSNWELLCIYCHDEEHSKFESLVRYGERKEGARAAATHNPFANLKARMEGDDAS